MTKWQNIFYTLAENVSKKIWSVQKLAVPLQHESKDNNKYIFRYSSIRTT